MADRYWVGGTANWDATAGTKWSATNGGAGGASVPTAADDVYFTLLSGLVTCTVSAVAFCRNLTTTGFLGTLAGGSNIRVDGSLLLNAGMTFTNTGFIQFTATSGSYTVTTAGKTLGAASFAVSASTATWTLQDALTCTGGVDISRGTLTTNNFNVTAASLSSSGANTRTINLGSSTVTITAISSPINFAPSTNLTFNAGTSTITYLAGPFAGGGNTFYNVSITGVNTSTSTISGVNTFNNLSVAGRTSAGVNPLTFLADQIINGTLTLSAGTNATMRTFVRSDTIGTTRTLTCNAATATDIDFRDITIAGSAAPVSGTRLGDCKGNSGITFPSAKTVYFAAGGGTNWGSTNAGGAWSLTNNGISDHVAFPLAQDTAVFPSSPTPYPSNGQQVTINGGYNIGTIDMSARTSNTMLLSTSLTPTIYGNWINGTGTTLNGINTLNFSGRGSQTITSAGKTFGQGCDINSPGGSVTLQDAYTNSRATAGTLNLLAGTFDANSYNVTLTGSATSFLSSNSSVRTVAIGSGTWTIAGTGGWNTGTSTNLTVTGTGTISLTSASAKAFAGGGIQTYPTLNQGGTGTLTVNGSNKFRGLTNTAIGSILFTGGTTNEFTTTFNIDGISGNLLQLGSTNTTQAILIKPTAWLMGANSTNGGNNTGLSFTGGGDLDYLSVSYINGQVSAAPSSNSNFFLMFA